MQSARATLQRALEAQSKDLSTALLLYEDVFRTLAAPQVSPQAWQAAYAGIVECIVDLSARVQMHGNVAAVDEEFAAAFGLLSSHADKENTGQAACYQRAVFHHVAAHVALAEQATDLATRESNCRRATEILGKAGIELRANPIEQPANDVLERLARQYVVMGDTYANDAMEDKASESYQHVYILLRDCQSANVWNEAVDSELKLARARLENAEADDSILNGCRAILALFKKLVGRRPDKKDRSALIEKMIGAGLRLANQANTPEERSRAANQCLAILGDVDETDDTRRHLISQIAQLIDIKAWQHSGLFHRRANLHGSKSDEPILAEWLNLCDTIIARLQRTADDASHTRLRYDAEILLANSESILSHLPSAKKRIGYRRIRYLLALNSDETSVVKAVAEKAQEVLMGFKLRVELKRPQLTLEIWQLALPALIKHAAQFLTGDRILKLIDLIERQRAENTVTDPDARERLDNLRRIVYYDLLRYEDYDKCQYEKLHSPMFGFFNKELITPLDHFFCLELARVALQDDGNPDRARELCRIAAKRFELPSKKQHKFRDRYFELVDAIELFSDRRDFLKFVLHNDEKQTKFDAYGRLISGCEAEARKHLDGGRFQDAINEIALALTYVKSISAEYLLTVPAKWRTKRAEVLDRLVDVCRRASDSCRQTDVRQANQYLVDALEYLWQRGRGNRDFDVERIEILKEFALGRQGDVAPGIKDAKLSFEHAKEVLKAADFNAEVVEHFLRLALLGGATDEAAFTHLLGRCFLRAQRWQDARSCFEQALHCLPKRIKSDTNKIRVESQHALATIAVREADTAADDQQLLDNLNVAIKYFLEVLPAENLPLRWYEEMILTLRRRSQVKDRKVSDCQTDLIAALNVVAVWQRRESAAAGVKEIRKQLLTDLSVPDLQVGQLSRDDADFSLQLARKWISRGEELDAIKHFLDLARHGRAIGESGFYYELGRAYQAHKNLDAARDSLQRVTEGDTPLAAKTQHGLGQIEIMAASECSRSDQRQSKLQTAIDHLQRAQELDAEAAVDEDLGFCYQTLDQMQSRKSATERRSVRENLVYRNANLRKAFVHYDKAHSRSQVDETEQKLRELGGGLGYLMLAAIARRENNGNEKELKFLQRCAEVFPDTGAGKLAVMIQLRAYPLISVNQSDHNLALAHFRLANKFAEQHLYACAEFLLEEALDWHDKFRGRDGAEIDRPTIESSRASIKELIDSLDEGGQNGAKLELSEPSADELGWRDVGTPVEMFRKNVKAAKELFTEIGPWVPISLSTAINTLDYLFSTFVSDDPFEAAKAQMDYGRELIEQLYPESETVRNESVFKIGRNVTSIAAKRENSELQFEFRVQSMDQINAFAVPGGFIVISQELIDFCAGEPNQLAFVIGHEAAHILQHHYMFRLFAGNLLDLLRKYGSERVIRLLSAGYSWDHELQADRLGVEYANAAQFDPKGAISFFEKMKRNDSVESFGSRFFRSHPPHATRIREIRGVIAKLSPAIATEAPIREPS